MNNRKLNRHERAIIKHQIEFKKEKMKQEKRNSGHY